jgi:CRISPR-associated protein Csm3
MGTYAKVKITATLELKSGLHIGGSTAFAAIGATDSPVIKDPATGLPVIPGSSIKGKMRSLLARALNDTVAKDPNGDDEKVKRLFGTSSSNIVRSRLVFADLVMSEAERQRLNELGARQVTEVKFENTIKRLTAEATPRQIERVIAGSKFDFSVVYEIGVKPGLKAGDVAEIIEASEIREDFVNIAQGLKLLEYDYLGGSGTRGYGKVKFGDARAQVVFGKVDGELLKELEDELSSI